MENIGNQIKELRLSRKITLKELSESTGLSIGFLSQFERGLSHIATDSLKKISDALKVDPSTFFQKQNNTHGEPYILRNYEKEVDQVINGRFINYILFNQEKDSKLLARLIELLPINSDEEIENYNHQGEEFVYVLEGVLTLFKNNQRFELYPGDSARYSSEEDHNWANYTNKMVKILVTSCL